jgi:hypothetical protein
MRVLETYRFGPHTVAVLEAVDDETSSYSIVVDGRPVDGDPLPEPPTFEEVVRIYARSQDGQS